MTENATRDDLKDARADIGIAIAKTREDWLQTLDLRLSAFLADVNAARWRDRLWTVGALALMKFDLPSSVTAGGLAVALGLATVKGIVVGFRTTN